MGHTTLDELLDADLGNDPVTGNGLSNHLPMALLGLEALGATGERLGDYAAGYQRRLVPARTPSQPIDPDDDRDLRESLGTGQRFADWRALFDHEVAAHGVDATLADRLPLLLPGLGGAAFHGVIRLGYAVEHGRPADVVAALAYLADSYRPATPKPTASRSNAVNAADLLGEIRTDDELRERRLAATGFSRRFAEAASLPALQRHLPASIGSNVDVNEVLQGVAAATHQLYRATADFFALHTMTATHATRLILDQLDSPEDRRLGVGSLVNAVATAYVVIGTPPVEAPELATDVPDWDQIAARAVQSDDVHVIKVVYTCRSEAAVWPDPRYVDTAARAVGLID